jgi:hypothetical protein
LFLGVADAVRSGPGEIVGKSRLHIVCPVYLVLDSTG